MRITAGKRLKKFRGAMTLAEAASGFKISREYWHHLENGRRFPSERLALRFERELGIDALEWFREKLERMRRAKK